MFCMITLNILNITDVAVCCKKHNDVVTNNNKSTIICSIRTKKRQYLKECTLRIPLAL